MAGCYIGMGTMSMMEGPWLSSPWVSGLDGFRNLFLIEELLWKIGFWNSDSQAAWANTTFEGGYALDFAVNHIDAKKGYGWKLLHDVPLVAVVCRFQPSSQLCFRFVVLLLQMMLICFYLVWSGINLVQDSGISHVLLGSFGSEGFQNEFAEDLHWNANLDG